MGSVKFVGISYNFIRNIALKTFIELNQFFWKSSLKSILSVVHLHVLQAIYFN